MRLQLRTVSIVDQFSPLGLDPTIRGTGKFRLRYERLAPKNIDNIGAKLATGELELEVKDAEKLPEQEKEGFTAWGKEIGGLQAGLGYDPGQKRAYSPGETVKLVVRVRNVGKEGVKFKYVRQFFIENPPNVTDGDGMPVPLPHITAFGFHALVDVNLAPGKEIELYELKLEPRSATQSVNNRERTLFGTGKFSVQYERLVEPDNDKVLGKLATGKLELEIKTETKEKGFTAWGKEVGGLQAGLGFRPYEKRACSHSETVKLVVRVRNVGKFLHPFFENQLTVKDGEGKPVPQQNVNDEIGGRTPGELKLAPGKEIDLHELKRELRPANESGNKRFESLYGTGKVSVQYEQVLGMPSMGVPGWKLDPNLGKLATGQLELEIKSAAATGVR
jgi:hypothetical protein